MSNTNIPAIQTVWFRFHGELVAADRKIKSGLFEVRLSRNHCWRKIRSAKRQLAQGMKWGDNRYIIQRKTAELPEDEAIGLYCRRCGEMIWLGEICYKRKIGKGRSAYYHAECAKIVHLI